MFKATYALVSLLALSMPSHLFAQQAIIARGGWEAFPNVEYQGGDATQPKRLQGMLVLTDSTIALHACAWVSCGPVPNDTSKPPFAAKALFTIALRDIKDVSSVSQVRGPGVGDKIALGMLAGDRTEEAVGIVYETATSAEAPFFKTLKTHANAVEAKIRFRLKKLGIELKGIDR